jgi:hypothetical protein
MTLDQASPPHQQPDSEVHEKAIPSLSRQSTGLRAVAADLIGKQLLLSTIWPALVSTFGVVGFVVSLYKAAELFLPHLSVWLKQQAAGYCWHTLGLALAGSLLCNLPRRKIQGRLLNRVTVEVRVADLFDLDGNPDLVIGTNNGFSTQIGNGAKMVQPRSVQGQFTQRYFAGRESLLERKLDEALGFARNNSANNAKRRMGRAAGKEIAEIHFSEESSSGSRTAYFLPVSNLNGDIYETTFSLVRRALDTLWNRAHSCERPLAINLLGTGVRGLKVDHQRLVLAIISSLADYLVQAAAVPTDHLIIVIKKENYRDGLVDLRAIRTFIETLAGGR